MTAFDYDTAERYARSHPDIARAFQLLGDGITITSPTDGQVLTYNSTTDDWENQTPSTFSDTFTSIEVDGVPQSTNAPTLDFDGVDFTLTESPTDSFDIVVNDSGIDHNATTNYDANQHIDHSSLSVVAGAGLTGGGTMIASRTVDVGAGTGITVNADDVALSAASQASLALADTATQPGDNVSTLTIDIASADLTDGTNIALLDAANTFTAENTFSQLIVGDPGLESTGITVAGTTYDGVSKISAIGSGTVSMLQIHRHSTTVPPNLVFSLSHSNTSAHTVVSSGDSLMQLDAVGHDGTDYAWGGRISFVVDGTPGNNDMPTRFEVDLSQDGTQNLTNELTINADGSVAFACASGTFTIGGTQAVVQGDNVSDLTVDIASTDLTDTSNLLRKDTAYQIINPATGTGNYLSVEDTNSTSNIYFRLRDAGTNKHTYLMRRGSSHATAADDVLFQSYDGTNWLNHYLYDDSSNIAYLYGGTYASASWKIALDNATGIKFNDNVNGGGNALTNITGNISLWTNDSGYFDASSDVDHGGVGGLTDDDHTQYSLISSQSGAPSSTPGRVGEVNVDTSSTTVYVSTGTSSSADWTAVGSTGGALSNVVEDTTPQLGGDLDLNGHGVTFPTGTVTDISDNNSTLATKVYVDSKTLDNYYFQAYRSSNQAISAATYTKIQFDTETADPQSEYDNATNYRYTPGKAGRYLVIAAAQFNSLADGGYSQVSVYKNGAVYRYGNIRRIGASSSPLSQVVAVVAVNGTTDYLEIYGRAISACNVNGASQTTWFEAYYIGP